MDSGPQHLQAFAQETAQVLAADRKSGKLRYLPDRQGNDEMEPGVTWRAYLAEGMLLCPMPGCGPFGRVVAGGSRRHHFAHPAGTSDHDRGTGHETLWHLSAKDVLHRWAHAHPGLTDWTLHVDDTPITMPDGWRRPDVLAVAPDGMARVAFEVQYSPLTGTDWKARHDFYTAAGVVDIWLFAHHGPQWRNATAGQRRRAELARSDPGWVATIQLSGLHQKMLQEGTIPLWLDPTAQMVGTATARYHPARTPHAWPGEDTTYTLPPDKTFPACHIAADALEQCQLDLVAGELLTPSRLVHRQERHRFLAAGRVAREQAARIHARLQVEKEERTRRRRAAEQEKRRAIAAKVAADQAERDKHERDELQRKEEEHSAAEARRSMPLREQFPPLFEQEPPPPARTPWWQPGRRRA